MASWAYVFASHHWSGLIVIFCKADCSQWSWSHCSIFKVGCQCLILSRCSILQRGLFNVENVLRKNRFHNLDFLIIMGLCIKCKITSYLVSRFQNMFWEWTFLCWSCEFPSLLAKSDFKISFCPCYVIFITILKF